MLIYRGAIIDAQSSDFEGLTPLHGAAAFGNVRMAQLFLEQGANAKPLY